MPAPIAIGGLLQLKTSEFTDINDCFRLEYNAVIGVFL